MRKKSLSKQPHKVRSYQASVKKEVEWEKLVDSTVAFVYLRDFADTGGWTIFSSMLGEQLMLFHNSCFLGPQMNCRKITSNFVTETFLQ